MRLPANNSTRRPLFVTSAKAVMEGLPSQEPSVFAQLVDRLRSKSDEELKMLYLRLFVDDLKKEWADFTAESDFGSVSEEDIVKAIQKSRYKQ